MSQTAMTCKGAAWRGAAAGLAVAMAATACGTSEGSATGPGDGMGGPVQVLAWDEGWRDELHEDEAFRYLIMEIAEDEEAAERAWADNVDPALPDGDGSPDEPGIYGDPDHVDQATHALVVVSSGASSTCRVWVDDVRTVDARVEIDLDREPAEACTDDLAPYRVVLAVERDRLPDTELLPITAVDLPSEGLADVDGEVVTYPAG